MLVLFPHKVVALNAVSREVVQQVPLTGRNAIGNPLGLASDAATGTVYLFTGPSDFKSVMHPKPKAKGRQHAALTHIWIGICVISCGPASGTELNLICCFLALHAGSAQVARCCWKL